MFRTAPVQTGSCWSSMKEYPPKNAQQWTFLEAEAKVCCLGSFLRGGFMHVRLPTEWAACVIWWKQDAVRVQGCDISRCKRWPAALMESCRGVHMSRDYKESKIWAQPLMPLRNLLLYMRFEMISDWIPPVCSSVQIFQKFIQVFNFSWDTSTTLSYQKPLKLFKLNLVERWRREKCSAIHR